MLTKRKIFIAGIILLIGIQFFQPERNKSVQASSQSFAKLYAVPQDVNLILQRFCKDCHSNNTSYPWYAHVQPVGWWLNRHIRKGKEDLNLDEFAGYTSRRQVSKLRAMKDQVTDAAMPLPFYTWIHTDARLNTQQRTLLINWLSATIDSLSTSKSKF